MITFALKIVYAIVQLIEGLLAVRFILEFFSANNANSFVSWIYQYSDPFIKPFEGVITYKFSLFGFPIDINTLVAIFFFAILGYMILGLVKAFRSEA
jgi:uncharacterized protein YggT (Ycf19 family)